MMLLDVGFVFVCCSVIQHGNSKQAAGVECDKGRRLKDGESGQITNGGEGGSLSVSMEGRAFYGTKGCTSRPQGQTTPAEQRTQRHSRAMTLLAERDTSLNSPRQRHGSSQQRQESQTRKNLGGLVVAAGVFRSFHARSEVVLRRKTLGSVYGGGSGRRSPSEVNVRKYKPSSNAPAGKVRHI